MEFPGGSDNYLAITGAAHPFLTGAETFHTPSLGDEEFELPPIALEPDLEELGEPPPGPAPFAPPPQPHPPHGPAPYGVGAALELPVAMMEPLELEPFSAPPPVTIDVPIGSLSPGGLLGPAHLTTIDQSELSSQLGLSLGGAGAGPTGAPPTLATPPPAPSPERQLSPPPSPPGTPPDELAAAPKPSPPAPPPAAAPPPRKAPKKPKKKKDPNEPQKPVSAYALFFRDTQAAIKGQNPSATFGEVSKIVASMWDSLGEEQKQVYKRKTEAAKQEYLRALEAYRAVQTSAEPAEPDPAPPPPASPDPAPPPPPPPITKILIPKQLLSPSLTVSSPGGVVTVIPATVVTTRGGGGAPGAGGGGGAPQIVTRSLLQPPPLQQMPPPPQQPPPQVTVLQPPPPLQAMQTPPTPPTPTPKIHQPPPPPPLHIKILPPPPLQIPPLRLEVAPAGGGGDAGAGTPPHTPQNGGAAPPEHLEVMAGDVVPEVESPPPMAVELVESPPRPRCVRLGCHNAPVASADWDEEYCSSECLVKHCRYLVAQAGGF